MLANSVSVSAYVSGIRLRFHPWAEITRCSFNGCLWDGIVVTGASLFDLIEHNEFYGVHRDAISYCQIKNNFSTTMWIRYNDFGAVGRYAILLDLFGGIEAAPRVVGNSFEHSIVSYFVLHPEWFVQGVVAGMCVINGGPLNWHDNRTEGISLTPGFIGELHCIATSNVSIRDDDIHNIICTAQAVSQPRTTALINFVTTNRYGDITDQRNYNCGSSGDLGGVCGPVLLSNIYNMGELIVADGVGITTRSVTAEAVDFKIVSFPVKSGSYATLIDPAGSSAVALSTITISGGTATATASSPHGFSIGSIQYLVIAGAIANNYNGVQKCTITSTTQFTFSSNAGSNATAAGTYGVVSIGDVRTYIGAASCSALLDWTSTNSTAGNIPQNTKNYGRWGPILAGRMSPIDSSVGELMLFDEFYIREGNNNVVDGSGAAKWNGYRGLTLNRSLTDLTIPETNYIDYPFLFGNIYDSSGSFVRYVEIAGAVATKRKIRYNFSAAPATGTWSIGDIVYNNAPASGGYIGWVCTASGSPGIWKTFGLIS
jgi:hypothetical protein